MASLIGAQELRVSIATDSSVSVKDGWVLVSGVLISHNYSGLAGHTPIRPGVKSIFRGQKIKKAKKLKNAIKNVPKGG